MYVVMRGFGTEYFATLELSKLQDSNVEIFLIA